LTAAARIGEQLRTGGPARREVPEHPLEHTLRESRSHQSGGRNASRSLMRRRLIRKAGMRPLPERERVCLGTGGQEGDFQRLLADRVALTHKLVQAPVPKQAVPGLVDVHAV
jgi:hypothetical protein